MSNNTQKPASQPRAADVLVGVLSGGITNTLPRPGGSGGHGNGNGGSGGQSGGGGGSSGGGTGTRGK